MCFFYNLCLNISKKYSNIKFHDDGSSDSRVVPFLRAVIQTDRHDEGSARFSPIFAKATN